MKKIFAVLILLSIFVCLFAEAGVTYSYTKPANITETIHALRTDVMLRGGSFNGNEQEGTFNFNGVNGSYRVNRDSVDLTIFYNDIYFHDDNIFPIPCGNIFTFEFDKPENITQAIQSVKYGIESKSGYFSGNEQDGIFRASGIVGRYEIAERVSVSIIEKPFIFTNTFIEREIKNYFLRK